MTSIFNSIESKTFIKGDGINHRIAVRLATANDTNWSSNVIITFAGETLTLNGLSPGVFVGLIDGVEPSTANFDRILVKDAGTASGGTSNSNVFNGIWLAVGGTTTSLDLIRAEDLKLGDKPIYIYCDVKEGTINQKSSFTCTNVTGSGIIDNSGTGIDFTQNALFNYQPGAFIYANTNKTLSSLPAPVAPSLLTQNSPGNLSWSNTSNFTLSPKHVVTVQLNAGAGVFTSLAAAIASIPVFPNPDAPSSSNQWVVRVYTGTYTEPAITIPSWVFVTGIEMDAVTFQPAAFGYTFFTFMPNSGLNFCGIQNTDPSMDACSFYNSGNFCIMHKVTFENCPKAISCVTDVSATQSSQVYLEYVDMTNSTTYALRCEDSNAPGGYGSFVSIENFFTFNHSDNAIIVHGPNTQLFAHATELQGDGTGNGICVRHGGDCNFRSKAISLYTNGITVNAPESTTIDPLSNGAVLPQATIYVNSTTGFLTAGILDIGGETINYTGITGNSFTGCTGGTGTLTTGQAVVEALVPNLLSAGVLFEQCTNNINIQNVLTTGHSDGYSEYLKTLIPKQAPFFITNKDQHVITVAQKGADFTSITAALAAITDNGPFNRYTIVIGPGIFVETQIVMKPYVTIKGQFQTACILAAHPSVAGTPFIIGAYYSALYTLTLATASYLAPPSYLVEFQGDPSGFHFRCDDVVFDTSGNLIHIGSINGPTIFLLLNPLINMAAPFVNGIYIEDSGPNNYPISYIVDNLIWSADNTGLSAFNNLFTCKSFKSPAPFYNIFGVFTNSSMGQPFLPPTGTGVILEGAVFCSLETCLFGGFNSAVTVNNSAESTKLLVSASTFNQNVQDINILNPNTTGSVIAVAAQSKVNIVPSTSIGVILNDPAGSIVVTGPIFQGEDWQDKTDITDQLQHAAVCGNVDDIPNLMSISGLNVSVPGGKGYVFIGPVNDNYLQYIIWNPVASLTLPDNALTWIYVDSTATVLMSPSEPSYITNIVLGSVKTYGGNVTYIQYIGPLINNKGTNIDQVLKLLFGPLVYSGCLATPGSSLTSRAVQVSSGIYYFGTENFNPTPNDNVTMIAYHGGSIETSITQVPLQWDNAGVLTPITAGMWVKHAIYILTDLTGASQYFLVYAQQQYSTESDADAGGLPNPPPTFVANIMPISGVVVTDSDPASPLAPTRFIDIRPRPGFNINLAGTAVNDHHLLLNLATGDDHPQYLLTNGTRIPTGNLQLGPVNIVGTGGNLFNGVDPTNHASRHLPGGADALATAAPVAISTFNQIGVAASFSRSDHIHDDRLVPVTPGIYGDAQHVAQSTIDAYGRTTNITNVLITGVLPGGLITSGSLAGSSYPSPVIANNAVTNAMLQNSTINVIAGTGLNTGGTVSLGGSVTLNLTVPVSIANGGTNSTTALTNGKIMVSSGGAIVEGTSSSNPTFTTETLSSLSNQLTFGTSNTITINAPTPTSSWIYTMPDVGANSSFVMTNGNQTINGIKSFTTPIAATSGGTGFSSYTTGDIIYASSSTALSKLADVATGNVLLSGGVGVAPLYGKVDLTTTVTGILPSANGGTGINTSTASNGQLLIGNGSGLTLNTLTTGNGINVVNGSGTITINNTGVTSWSADTTGFTPNIATTGDITLGGILNNLHGGTGLDTSVATNGQILIGNGSGFNLSTITQGTGITVANASGSITISNNGVTSFLTNLSGLTPSSATTGAIVLSGTLGATSGGTGFSSYTIGDLLYASSSTALSKLADVATGNALISGGVGVAPSWGKIDLTTTVTGILPPANGGTGINTSSASNGQILIGNGSGLTLNTISGTTNQVNVTNGSGTITLSTPNTFIAPGTIQDTTGMLLSTTNGITATGATQGTATQLTTSFNVVSTVASGTGVILQTPSAGGLISVIVNKGANILNIYPQSGGAIDSAGTNNPISLPVGNCIILEAATTTQWCTISPYLAAGTGISVVPSNGNVAISNTGVLSWSAGTTGLTPNSATTGAVTLAGTLVAINGGTGFSSYTAGDLLYASSSTALSKLADVATGNALISGGVGVAPSWGKIDLTTTVTGILPPANGGTGINTSAASNGQLLIGNGSGLSLNTLTQGTGITITNGSGTITVANSGVLSFSAGTTGLTPNSATNGAVTLAGTLIAVNGGTGFSSYTIGDLLYASSSTALSKLADVATGNALISGGVGVAPSWGKINLTTTVTGILPPANGGTGINTSTATNGQILIGNGSGLSLNTITQGTGITITNGSGTITVTNSGVTSFRTNLSGLTPSSATTGAVTLSGTLGATSGGTGQTSYTIGDLLYASASNALSKLADVATGNALISGGVGVAPSWGKINLTTTVTGILPTANGGTGINTSTATNGQLLIGNGSGLTLSTLTAGSNITITNAAGMITIAATGSGTSAPITVEVDGSQLTINNTVASTLAYFPWQDSRYGAFTSRTVRMWVVPGSVSRNLTVSVLPNGGAAIGTTTINGGSATGIYTFTFTAPGADTRLDFTAVRSAGAGTSPIIYGITIEMA